MALAAAFTMMPAMAPFLSELKEMSKVEPLMLAEPAPAVVLTTG